MTFQRLLCPTDFSAGSQRAMRVAVRVADDARAELVLCHAWYVPSVAFSTEGVVVDGAYDSMRDEARSRLAAAEHEARELGATRVSTRFVEGQPWHAIVGVLEDAAFDLVVIGTHGRTGLARVAMGSVAESVVRHAPCSVLTVGPTAEARSFRHALCPVDLSERSKRSVELAASSVGPDGRLTLLHVVDSPAHAGLVPSPEWSRELVNRGVAAVEQWSAQLALPVPAKVRVRGGAPGATILAMLDEDSAIDLVVVGSHGRTGLARALMGSVAEKLVRHARCPVLVCASPRS